MANKSNDTTTDLLVADKRMPKCPGCKVPHNVHSFGDPGPHCSGTTGLPFDDDAPSTDFSLTNPTGAMPPESSPQPDSGIPQPTGSPPPVLVEDEEAALLAKLHELKMAEEELEKKRRVQKLKEAIAEAEKRLSNLVDSLPGPSVSSKTSSSTVSNTLSPAMMATTSAAKDMKFTSIPQTPLDAMIVGYKTKQNGHRQEDQHGHLPNLAADVSNPDGPLAGPLAAQESAMYLKLAQLAKGEKVLRIVDFIDKIVSNTEDRTISDLGTTKLVISSWPKKPKIESVSIAQWVVGNTRIFHHLFSSGKLPSPQDVQHYLAYTVKIMELSAKFSWPSVLHYDDEFRHVQAVYNYPWSFDSHHLHTVTLEPIVVAAKPSLGKFSQGTSLFANYSQDARIICRNFNRVRGCTLYECNFAHICNRKVNGKACGQSHPSHSHPGGGRGAPQGQQFSATSS